MNWPLRKHTVRCCIVLSVAITSSCQAIQAQAACTNDVLSRFKRTQIASLSYTLANGGIFPGMSVQNEAWSISGRTPTSCVVTLTADVNGTSTEAFRYYIDLSAGKIFPDDLNAQRLALDVPDNQLP